MIAKVIRFALAMENLQVPLSPRHNTSSFHMKLKSVTDEQDIFRTY